MHKSLQDFFKKARENSSEMSKDTLVTGKEVRKNLQPHTEKRYARIIAIFTSFRHQVPRDQLSGGSLKS
jgi:hypothetical protein